MEFCRIFPWLDEQVWHEGIEVTDAQRAFVIKAGRQEIG